MLERVLALLLGTLFLTTAPAQAEPRMMGIALHCDDEPGTIIQMVQEKYGELPFATAEGIVQNITGRWQPGTIIQTVNPEELSFSIIIIDPISGVECLLLAGNSFAPALFEPKGDPM
jgi:hypothetical protein